MDLNFSRQEKIVGTFLVTVVLILLAVVIVIGRGKDWYKTYATYYATFNQSYDLQENAAVKLFKANIGKVRRITLVENKVKVELGILEEYANHIRSDSVATVESPTFIGSEYVSIIPGNAASARIPDNGEIPSKEKKSISDLLAEFQVEKTAKMLIKAVQDLSDAMLTLRDPAGPLFSALGHLDRTTENIEKITADIQAGKGTLGELFKSRSLIEALHKNMDSVREILQHIARASAKTPKAMDQVQDNLSVIKQVGTHLSESVLQIQRILKEVEKDMQAVERILANIENGSLTVPEIMQSTKFSIQEIREGVENADKIFKSLQKNFLIRPNIPPEPVGKNIDAGLRK
ncbi:MAG: MlaD family protein [Desulfobacterales bacterium]|nr:MlaD family protein [Desulfobacterales bacterium]